MLCSHNLGFLLYVRPLAVRFWWIHTHLWLIQTMRDIDVVKLICEIRMWNLWIKVVIFIITAFAWNLLEILKNFIKVSLHLDWESLSIIVQHWYHLSHLTTWQFNIRSSERVEHESSLSDKTTFVFIISVLLRIFKLLPWWSSYLFKP